MSQPVSSTDVKAADALYSWRAFKFVVADWSKQQIPLIEACCLALCLHVLAFPVIWFLGWALPWPKSPVITTVIEIDLRDWPNSATPDKLFHYRDPELNR